MIFRWRTRRVRGRTEGRSRFPLYRKAQTERAQQTQDRCEFRCPMSIKGAIQTSPLDFGLSRELGYIFPGSYYATKGFTYCAQIGGVESLVEMTGDRRRPRTQLREVLRPDRRGMALSANRAIRSCGELHP